MDLNKKHLLVIVFLGIIILVSSVIIFSAVKDINPLSQTYGANFNLGKFLVIGHVPPLEPIPGWNHVDKWKLQQCRINLNSERDFVVGSQPDKPYFFSTKAEITVQARTTKNIDGSFENSLGWFIQTFNTSEDYNITVFFDDGLSEPLSKISGGVGSGRAQPTGTSNFYAWLSDKKPSFVQLKVGDVGVETIFVNSTKTLRI